MRKLGLLLGLVLLVATGCNKSEEGTYGNILFTPDECGHQFVSCDFANSIGVGGTIQVHIEGIDGFITAGVTLDSDDPSVADVVAVADVGGRPTWEVTALGAGVAGIRAWDADDEQVDLLQVGVQELVGFTLDNIIGNGVGPTTDAVYDETWVVNADENTSFHIVPLIAGEPPAATMGIYDFIATVDFINAELVDGGTDLGTGYLYFNAPTGDYEVDFESTFDSAMGLSVLITAQ